MSRVDVPRAYISQTRRSRTSELPSKNDNSCGRKTSPAPRTWGTDTETLPSAMRSLAGS